MSSTRRIITNFAQLERTYNQFVYAVSCNQYDLAGKIWCDSPTIRDWFCGIGFYAEGGIVQDSLILIIQRFLYVIADPAFDYLAEYLWLNNETLRNWCKDQRVIQTYGHVPIQDNQLYAVFNYLVSYRMFFDKLWSQRLAKIISELEPDEAVTILKKVVSRCNATFIATFVSCLNDKDVIRGVIGDLKHKQIDTDKFVLLNHRLSALTQTQNPKKRSLLSDLGIMVKKSNVQPSSEELLSPSTKNKFI